MNKPQQIVFAGLIFAAVGIPALVWYPPGDRKPHSFLECEEAGGIPVSAGHPAYDTLYKCVLLEKAK